MGINFLVTASWTDIAFGVLAFWGALCIAVAFIMGHQ
jgi:hypothetical protein